MAVQYTFNRYEKKYILSPSQYSALREALEAHMETDQYGLHTICNIYLDSEDDFLVRSSIEKPVYKEKVRLRSYGIPKMEDTVFLEIKKKYRGIVNKRRVSMTLAQWYGYLDSHTLPQDGQISREISYLVDRRNLSPKLYLAYDRVAMYDREDPTFRLTMDTNIRSRWEDLRLEHGDRGDMVLPPDTHLMEVKVTAGMPLWFCRLLDQYEIYPASFSKYGTVYQRKAVQHAQHSTWKEGAEYGYLIGSGNLCWQS